MSRAALLSQMDPRADHWLAIMRKHDVQFLILNKRRDAEFLQLVESSHRWVVEWAGGDSMIFRQRETGSD